MAQHALCQLCFAYVVPVSYLTAIQTETHSCPVTVAKATLQVAFQVASVP